MGRLISSSKGEAGPKAGPRLVLADWHLGNGGGGGGAGSLAAPGSKRAGPASDAVRLLEYFKSREENKKTSHTSQQRACIN